MPIVPIEHKMMPTFKEVENGFIFEYKNGSSSHLFFVNKEKNRLKFSYKSHNGTLLISDRKFIEENFKRFKTFDLVDAIAFSIDSIERNPYGTYENGGEVIKWFKMLFYVLSNRTNLNKKLVCYPLMPVRARIRESSGRIVCSIENDYLVLNWEEFYLTADEAHDESIGFYSDYPYKKRNWPLGPNKIKIDTSKKDDLNYISEKMKELILSL